MVASSRDLVMACTSGHDVERTPFLLPFIGYYSCITKGVTHKQARNKPMLAANAQMQCIDEIRCDGTELIYDSLSIPEALGCEVEYVDYEVTPTVEPVFRNIEKLDTASLIDPEDDYRFVASLQTANIILGLDDAEHYSYSAIAAPFSTAAEVRGIQNFFLDLTLQPDIAQRLIDYISKVVDAYLDELLELNSDALLIVDPISSGKFITAEQYSKFVLPSVIRISNRCASEDKQLIWHICTDAYHQAKLLSPTKIDVVAIDKPVKLVAISDALPGKTILGNIATENVLCLEPQAIYREACTKIEAMRGRKYILGAGCGVHDAPIENVRMFRAASDDCSRLSR